MGILKKKNRMESTSNRRGFEKFFNHLSDMLDPIVLPQQTIRKTKKPQIFAIDTKTVYEEMIKRADSYDRHSVWWESSCVTYRFNDPVVRHRMVNLMGTEVVRLLDRDFMATLANRLVERNCELIKRRIEDRKNWELDRERQLVFDGKLPLEDGPPGFSEHPYFAIMSKVAEEVAKRKARIEAHKVRKRLIPMFDYSIFVSDKSEHKVKESTSDISLIDDVLPDLNIVEAEKQNCELVLKKMIERDMIDVAGYERARYEHLQVKALRKAKTVEDMYKMAAKIFMTA
ncbi:uncharacterized protein LOC106667962 isoform X2 [Cimex lectularius]|uniref:Uncharacterized protein n=1 Tax=Cimex lectularius TaxID=79782 RepID=A0A8I6RSW0_CIMLE|nr:uncharacterized protein LOC106667962 isoform X2 [Cimex lectularius]